MQLCKQAKESECNNVPEKLPKNLIPPLFRRGVPKNDILYRCNEQIDMGTDDEYSKYLQSQDQTIIVTHKLCIICFKWIERSNFSRHWKNICKQQPISAVGHQPCPYCPPEHQGKIYRSDNLNNHLLNDHQIGKMDKMTRNNKSLNHQKCSRKVSSTLRISTGANKSWSSEIVTTNEQSSMNPSSDIPEFSEEVEVKCMEETDTENDELNQRISGLEKEKQESRQTIELLEKEKLDLKTEFDTFKQKIQKEKETLEETLMHKIAAIQKEKLLNEQKHFKIIQELRTKLIDKNKLITKDGQEITARLIEILLADDPAEVLIKLNKLLKMKNTFITDDVKYWCHKELSEMYKSEDPLEMLNMFRHLTAALQIKFDESMMSTFKKIKSSMLTIITEIDQRLLNTISSIIIRL